MMSKSKLQAMLITAATNYSSLQNVIVVWVGVVKSSLHVHLSYFTETIFHIHANGSINSMNMKVVLQFK